MRPLPLLTLLCLALLAASAAGGDVLSEYRKRFRDDSTLSEKRAVLDELAATSEPRARTGLQHCVDVQRKLLGELRKEAERSYQKVLPLQQEFDERLRKWLAQEAERGNPNPTHMPTWLYPEKYAELRAELERLEGRVIDEQEVLDLALACQGRLLAALPEPEQQAAREEWQRVIERNRDWEARAEVYRSAGAVPATWALELLVRAAQDEPDPRALVHAVHGLGGREAGSVLPALVERLNDTRWLVRAAALEALSRTPSRETVDAVIARMPMEHGRLLEDCARLLEGMTGHTGRTNVDAWRRYWEEHREAWAGVPPPHDPLEDEFGQKLPPDAGHRRTGFFGIETPSRRLVYVIDVSGSMNEKVSADDPRTRAELAKEELKQAVRGLEDGTLFDIVFFSSAIVVWKPEMVVASVETRREAAEFVDSVQVVGGTATYDGLLAAFDLGEAGKARKREQDPSGEAPLDTIVLLSDGKPSLGRILKPDLIRSALRDLNRSRRVTIHAIAFGADADAAFLSGLAGDSGGQFRAR